MQTVVSDFSRWLVEGFWSDGIWSSLVTNQKGILIPNLGNQSEQSILPSVHQRGRHHQHHASHMTKSHDTHAHDWLKGKWRRSHGKYKKIKKLM